MLNYISPNKIHLGSGVMMNSMINSAEVAHSAGIPLECYSCSSISGNTEEACWKLSSSPSPVSTTEDFDFDEDDVPHTKCNDKQHYCKVRVNRQFCNLCALSLCI